MLFTFTLGRPLMVLVEKLDELGKPAWIALIVLGFMAWWPVGLVALAFFLGSGRMGCGYRRNGGQWQSHWQSKMERMQEKMDRMRSKMEGAGSGNWWGAPPSSGNRAFDDYRDRNASAPGRRAARVQGVSGAAALCQGQVGVRPVHERTPQPSAEREVPSRRSRKPETSLRIVTSSFGPSISSRWAARAF